MPGHVSFSANGPVEPINDAPAMYHAGASGLPVTRTSPASTTCAAMAAFEWHSAWETV